ncbi:hypothetical protein LI82_03745 [Methanococcoides methylutens]|uniref:Aminotransferase DegT n=1 Tax=Methanococcoides methylutens TaxID=2226 RepID=A0A099T232_METMT|nr:DegT/DnrJ/EryC1/StrS family aminotransferase [Methanococcoides methylutens]KGK99152.1 hypothetical protein LI82_03745 [Methanococcoides methylutens]
MIPVSQAPIYIREILKTVFAYSTNYSTESRDFQDQISNYLGCRHINLTSSGFSGLYSILRSSDLKKGDEVIVPAYTCEDVPRLVIEMGYKVKFVDIEPCTCNMDPIDLHDKISKDTKVVIAAHMFGYPCSIVDITETSHDYGAIVVEDSCQSMGAEYNGKKVGTFGDVGLFSLNMGKPISTIHGGIICTNNKDFSEKISAIIATFNDCSIMQQMNTFAHLIGYSFCNNRNFYSLIYKLIGEKHPNSYFEIQDLMYKFTEFQSILGIQQLSKLDTFNNIRIKNANYLMDNLKPYGLFFPKISKQTKPIFLRLPIYFENVNRANRNKIITMFKHSGIEITPYLLRESLPFLFAEGSTDYPRADRMTSNTLTIPTHPGLTNDNLDQIIDLLNNRVDI